MMRVHRLYKKDDASLRGVCVYCGQYAQTVDHVPAVSIAADMSFELLKQLGPKLFPACQHCNNTLGDSHELLLVDRRDLVARRLAAKNTRMLARGKFLFERQIPIHGDARELACLRVYERWLFASVTQNEATPEPEPEEDYRRQNFTKGIDKARLSEPLWLASWGLPDELARRTLSREHRKILDLAERFSETRGPLGWSFAPRMYLARIQKDLGESRAEELVKELVEHGGTLSFLATIIHGFLSGAYTEETTRCGDNTDRNICKYPANTWISPSRQADPKHGKPNSNLAQRKRRIELFTDELDGVPAMELMAHAPLRLVDFPPVREDEIRRCFNDLQFFPVARARDFDLQSLKPFLKPQVHKHLSSGDGLSFFKAVALSENCPPKLMREILTLVEKHEKPVCTASRPAPRKRLR